MINAKTETANVSQGVDIKPCYTSTDCHYLNGNNKHVRWVQAMGKNRLWLYDVSELIFKYSSKLKLTFYMVHDLLFGVQATTLNRFGN